METCIVQLGQSVEAYWPTLVELVFNLKETLFSDVF
jgi:hypothetical protein